MWLDKAIERGVKRAFAEALESDALRDAVWEAMRRNPRMMFLKRMQARYQAKCPDLTDRQAFEAARNWLNTFLEWEKIEFGDIRYTWDREGANDLADEDMSHWETQA